MNLVALVPPLTEDPRTPFSRGRQEWCVQEARESEEGERNIQMFIFVIALYSLYNSLSTSSAEISGTLIHGWSSLHKLGGLGDVHDHGELLCLLLMVVVVVVSMLLAGL